MVELFLKEMSIGMDRGLGETWDMQCVTLNSVQSLRYERVGLSKMLKGHRECKQIVECVTELP